MPALHPTLAALFIVLAAGASADLSEIGRTYRDVRKHSNYSAWAKFPDDISNLLPPPGERWWETLGKSSSTFSSSFSQYSTVAEARRGQEAPDPPRPLPKVRLILPPNPEAPKDVEMEEVDELEDDDYVLVSD